MWISIQSCVIVWSDRKVMLIMFPVLDCQQRVICQRAVISLACPYLGGDDMWRCQGGMDGGDWLTQWVIWWLTCDDLNSGVLGFCVRDCIRPGLYKKPWAASLVQICGRGREIVGLALVTLQSVKKEVEAKPKWWPVRKTLLMSWRRMSWKTDVVEAWWRGRLMSWKNGKDWWLNRQL